MTRDDLYGYYRRNYVPNNATLVIVGDVETDDVVRRVQKQFGGIAPGTEPRRVRAVEPEQFGERRIEVAREGTTAYLKLAYHAPGVNDADFFPMLVLDAILTGAKGINLWSSFRTPLRLSEARVSIVRWWSAAWRRAWAAGCCRPSIHFSILFQRRRWTAWRWPMSKPRRRRPLTRLRRAE